jgi:TolB-like protein/Tfp pilus assembly protein PilF
MPMSASAKAVFLSYASQDAQAALRVCEALRQAQVEVWLDQSELRGGDAWDAMIRRQIKECALFVPIISANTQAREEGYFRLEWRLAVDRSHLMADGKPFLLPVVIDSIRDADALVPEKFREVQWTRLGAGVASAAFVERVRRLLFESAAPALPAAPDAAPAQNRRAAAPAGEGGVARGPTRSWAGIALGALVVAGAVVFIQARTPASAPAAAMPGTAAVFSPPPHSVAVLPFVNMSGDPRQDYFSDGLSEELLNSLVTIPDLQVAARTSSFSFKGKDVDLAEVARKLNVGAVLEGSVRKDGSHVRITAQLINAVTGFHLWSKTYDRDLRDILKLQTEIATAVTGALQATLLAENVSSIELGGTRDSQALDAYLRGERLADAVKTTAEFKAQLADFEEAIRRDPGYAKAYVGKAMAWSFYARTIAGQDDLEHAYRESREAANRAIAMAPDLGAAHAALGIALAMDYHFAEASAQIEQALALSPGDARVLRSYPFILAAMGRDALAISSAQRAIALDPLNAKAYTAAGYVLSYVHRYREAIDMFDRAFALDPTIPGVTGQRGYAHLKLGEVEAAQASCVIPPVNYVNQACLAIAYYRLKRPAEAMEQRAALKASLGESASYQMAEIHAQWGEPAVALDWLETGYRVRDSGMVLLRVDQFMDPLRKEPRFQEIYRKLNFPS